jgi:hypothetical protein
MEAFENGESEAMIGNKEIIVGKGDHAEVNENGESEAMIGNKEIIVGKGDHAECYEC